jgi:hypothetical protein
VITRFVALERDLGVINVDFAGMHAWLDNVSHRLDQIERRLDLVDAHTS